MRRHSHCSRRHSQRSALPKFSVSSPVSTAATASRNIYVICRAYGPISSVRWRIPALAPLAAWYRANIPVPKVKSRFFFFFFFFVGSVVSSAFLWAGRSGVHGLVRRLSSILTFELLLMSTTSIIDGRAAFFIIGVTLHLFHYRVAFS